MNKQYYHDKLLEIRLKIAYLPLKERELGTHPYFQELKDLKKEYAKYLCDELTKEKESEENDKYKRRWKIKYFKS